MYVSFVLFTSIVILSMSCFFFFFFKQKTAYEIRISDWSSDVCSSDLMAGGMETEAHPAAIESIAIWDGRVPARRRIDAIAQRHDRPIGSASCRERVCQYV